MARSWSAADSSAQRDRSFVIDTPRPLPVRRKHVRRSVLNAVGLLVVGASMGWLLRGWISPAAPAEFRSATASLRSESDGSRTAIPGALPRAGVDARVDFWSASAFYLANRVGSLEALISEMQAQEDDPNELIAVAIANSSDEDLIAITSAVTRIDDETLRRSHDVRAFAQRLAEVAIQGLSEEASVEPSGGHVDFAASAVDYDPEALGQQTFSTDQAKIYAIVSLPDYDGRHVMMKWSHLDSGRIHAFSRRRVSRDIPIRSWHEPTSDWAEGTYRVDVFTADDAVLPLARGEYVIEERALASDQ
jgi:hypothetical protein